MNPTSIEFIYKAMNALASRKHDPEQCLADAIEHELLMVRGRLTMQESHSGVMSFPGLEAYISDFPAA
jgi:hypothetical protein